MTLAHLTHIRPPTELRMAFSAIHVDWGHFGSGGITAEHVLDLCYLHLYFFWDGSGVSLGERCDLNLEVPDAWSGPALSFPSTFLEFGASLVIGLAVHIRQSHVTARQNAASEMFGTKELSRAEPSNGERPELSPNRWFVLTWLSQITEVFTDFGQD
jgi:hypothetical protein